MCLATSSYNPTKQETNSSIADAFLRAAVPIIFPQPIANLQSKKHPTQIEPCAFCRPHLPKVFADVCLSLKF